MHISAPSHFLVQVVELSPRRCGGVWYGGAAGRGGASGGVMVCEGGERGRRAEKKGDGKEVCKKFNGVVYNKHVSRKGSV